MLNQLAALHDQQQLLVQGGGAKYVRRHRARGKLLSRERIELLLDPDSPFLEFSTLAAWGTEFHVGAGIVTGMGAIADTVCVIIAHESTIRGGSMNPITLKKNLRAMEIARENRLPLVNLVESGGADLPTQAELFVPAGELFRNLTRLSALGIPTISLVFGNSTAGGAYIPGMCDYTVMVKERAKVFLGGPPLVKMATGEDADDEELGGADMHSRISGLSDALAVDEHDCLRIGRQIIANLHWKGSGPAPAYTQAQSPPYPVATPAPTAHATSPPRSILSADTFTEEPLYDTEDLLGLASCDLKIPIDVHEVIARIVDGSRFDEFKPLYGSSLVTGWACLHGYPIGILANSRGILFSEEAEKAAQFIQLANQVAKPLVFLQNTTGYMVGKAYEQGGMVKNGAKMVNAVSNSQVPHLTIIMGASYGAGNYGMCGRAYDPRFLFSWPNHKMAVMGPEQLAGVLSIVARQAAAAAGRPFDEEADTINRQKIQEQIEAEQIAFANSSRLYDDGIIDPRDTRTVLGMCLTACHMTEVHGTETAYGVFRM